MGIWSLNQCIEKVNQPGGNTDKDQRESTSPLFNFQGHQSEGFAMNWSPTMPGVLATGNCKLIMMISLIAVHYLMKFEPNWKKIPQNSRKLVVWQSSVIKIRKRSLRKITKHFLKRWICFLSSNFWQINRKTIFHKICSPYPHCIIKFSFWPILSKKNCPKIGKTFKKWANYFCSKTAEIFSRPRFFPGFEFFPPV